MIGAQHVLSILRHAGKKTLEHKRTPMLATVSGVVTTKPALIAYVDRTIPQFEIITTKSFQVKYNPGNREPIICEMEIGSFGNSVGLRNCGMDEALDEITLLRKKGIRALLNVSISGSSAEDFILLAIAFHEVADILELNFSCPHAAAGYGSSIGCDPSITAMYVKAIKEALPACKALIFPKLTPNVDDIGLIARSAIEAGADGLVAINTVGPVIHKEHHSGKPILQNALGGKGGKSGRWVLQDALRSVARIREAVGPDIPIIGMGGVSTGSDIVAMLEHGADVVGIGSAFGKVMQKHWADYAADLVDDAQHILNGGTDPQNASNWYNATLSMSYEPHKVIDMVMHDNDTAIITLDGAKPFEAGQFVFLWIPGVGEKPFSIAIDDPLTFVVKRKGVFTDALLDLKTGDDIYVRGLYGAAVETPVTKHAVLIAGGTGIAVLPALARSLYEKKTDIDMFIGTSAIVGEEKKGILEEHLEHYGTVTVIADDGIVARVLQHVSLSFKPIDSTAVYIVGPEKFMAKAAHLARKAGIGEKNILLSMELSTMCGIGMCGECVCGERLTCQWGTFVSYDYLEREAPHLL